MKYVCFYDDGNYYYCYSDDGKIYRGIDAKNSTGELQYLVYIMALNFIMFILNEILQDKLNNILSFIITAFGFVASAILGFVTYKKIITKADKKLMEIYLSDEQFKEYIIQGRKRFSIDVLILYIIISISIFSFVFFYFQKNSFFLIVGVIFNCLSAIELPWIAPLKKYRFYKKMRKTDNKDNP